MPEGDRNLVIGTMAKKGHGLQMLAFLKEENISMPTDIQSFPPHFLFQYFCFLVDQNDYKTAWAVAPSVFCAKNPPLDKSWLLQLDAMYSKWMSESSPTQEIINLTACVAIELLSRPLFDSDKPDSSEFDKKLTAGMVEVAKKMRELYGPLTNAIAQGNKYDATELLSQWEGVIENATRELQARKHKIEHQANLNWGVNVALNLINVLAIAPLIMLNLYRVFCEFKMPRLYQYCDTVIPSYDKADSVLEELTKCKTEYVSKVALLLNTEHNDGVDLNGGAESNKTQTL